MRSADARPVVGPSTVPGQSVRLRPRVTGRAVHAAVLTVPPLALVVLLVGGSGVDHAWVVWLVLLTMVPSVVLRWLVVAKVARQPWAVDLGPAGVTWFGASRPALWPDLERVEVHLTRGLRRLLPHGFDRVLLVTPVEADFADRAGTAPTSRAVVLAQVRSTPAEVVAAVRRFSDVPVHGWPDGR